MYRRFLEVAGQQAYQNADTRALLADVIAQFQEVTNRLPGATQAVQGPVAKTAATGTGSSTAGAVASTVLKSGFGLAPLVEGLVSLFKGSEPEAPPALVKYAMPTSIQFQAAESSSRMTALDYDQTGLARSYPTQGTAPSQPAQSQQNPQSAMWQLPSESQQAPRTGTTQQITVNVQAMDRPVVFRPEQRHRSGGEGRDAQPESDQ